MPSAIGQQIEILANPDRARVFSGGLMPPRARTTAQMSTTTRDFTAEPSFLTER